MIKKVILGVIKILGYILVGFIFLIGLVVAFTFGVCWLGDASGGFTP